MRAFRQDTWVDKSVGAEAEAKRKRFHELVQPGSGYRTTIENGIVKLLWPMPRRIERVRGAEVARSVRQAERALPDAAAQGRAFAACAKLGTYDVSGERHFQAIGGCLLRAPEDAEAAAAAGPAQPLQLAVRKPDVACSQESDAEQEPTEPSRKKVRTDTPEVLHQRRLLEAAKQQRQLVMGFSRAKAAGKSLEKFMKKSPIRNLGS